MLACPGVDGLASPGLYMLDWKLTSSSFYMHANLKDHCMLTALDKQEWRDSTSMNGVALEALVSERECQAPLKLRMRHTGLLMGGSNKGGCLEGMVVAKYMHACNTSMEL